MLNHAHGLGLEMFISIASITIADFLCLLVKDVSFLTFEVIKC